MAAIDIDALRAELTNDPAALGYAGKSAIECKRLLRDTLVSVQVPASIEAIEAICMTTVVASAQVNPQGLPVWWVLKKAAATDIKAELAFDLFGSSQKSMPLVGFWRTKVFSDLRDAGYLNAATFNASNAQHALGGTTRSTGTVSALDLSFPYAISQDDANFVADPARCQG